MIPQIGAGSSYSTSSTEKTNEMGQDVFLKLLITQLKHQDPLEPMEGTQFVTQLAQFSELEQMRAMTGGQENLQNYMASLNNFAAVSLLGKEAEFSGDRVTHQEGSSSEIRFTLPSDAAQVAVHLYDAGGRLVHTLNAGPMGAGSQRVFWNGTDDTGRAVPAGTFRFEIAAQDGTGGAVPARLIQRGTVQEVAFKDGVPTVRIGDRWISLSEIEGIRMSSIG